jgi:hypothetical protein
MNANQLHIRHITSPSTQIEPQSSTTINQSCKQHHQNAVLLINIKHHQY